MSYICVCEICGHTRQGAPVLVLHLVPRNSDALEAEEEEQAAAPGPQILGLLHDRMRVARNRLGWPVHQFALVLNLDALHFRDLASVGGLRKLLQIWGDYSRHLAACHVINGSFALRCALRMFRHVWLSEEMADKIRVYGRGRAAWRETLRDRISADALPPELGGCCIPVHTIIAKFNFRT